MNETAPVAHELISQTTQKQRQAADPAVSAWVSANAGSGKTHVLVQRIIRLMLNGAEPGKILALTYTTAAAANMANRVFTTLSDWTALGDAALSERLAELGETASPKRLKAARQLFARAIETPGGLKIQTIHAFCERVLHLFPFEANVPAKFEVLEEVASAELIGEALHFMLIDALSGENDALSEALAIVSGAAAETTVKDLIRAGIHLRQRLAEEGQAADAGLAEAFLAIDPRRTVEDVMQDAVHGGFAKKEWLSVAGVMRDAIDWRMNRPKPPKSMVETDIAEMFELLPHAETLDQAYALYCGPFLTGKSEIRSSHNFLSAVKNVNPAMHERMLAELTRLGDLRDELCRMATAERTRALMTLVDATLERYRSMKIVRGALDFADLIARTRALFSRAGAAFVLYKLDAGIEHLLVDEAQDTSHAQWDIIKALTSEFFAGRTASTAARSVFAVGDPKQSIYSFQGAAPDAFEATQRHFAKSIEALRDAEGGDRRSLLPIALSVSFRSAKLIMESVDGVFRESRARGVQDGGTVHESVRLNAPAHVELWEIPEKAETPDRDTWQLPVDEPDEQAPVVKLANRIAKEVARLIAPGSTARIEDKGVLRPIAAGDIMILVRRRNVLFERVIRALKERNIPVAGADRLNLNAHIAVLDLVSLGRAMLLPDDDLSLAEILTSPLFGLNEYDLLKFAPQRGSISLDAAMRAAAEGDRRLAAALKKFDDWRALAREGGAFTFYARVLGSGRARRAMLGRLGPEAGDAVDEFLRVALDHDRRNIPSLSLFLATFEESDITIKRDMDLAGDQVRVMTVHGAKGLEAPIVILPDTCTIPTTAQIDSLSIYTDAKGRRFPLWAVGKDNECRTVNAAREAMVGALCDEYRRLLYVALTRAKDRLIIAGYHHTTPNPECWYKMVETALADRWITRDMDGETVRVIEDLRTLPEALSRAAPAPVRGAVPDWLGVAPPPPEAAQGALRPSAGNEFSGSDPKARRLALAVGSFAHRLLEILPDLPATRRAEAAARFAAARGQDIPSDKRTEIVEKLLALIASPALGPLFGPGSRGEVDIVGSLARDDGEVLRVKGQVDRLAVTAEAVVIADYKTNAVPPKDEASIADGYVEQLALYRSVIGPLYPGKPVRSVLIYTADQSVHELSEARLAAALHRLRSGSART